MKPQRIQLSRRAGFRLQEMSRKLNGLPAVNCARPGPLGNPYRIGHVVGDTWVEDARQSVILFQTALCYIMAGGSMSPPRLHSDLCDIISRLPESRGKNLACWCPLPKPGEPDWCHAAVLLEIANK